MDTDDSGAQSQPNEMRVSGKITWKSSFPDPWHFGTGTGFASDFQDANQKLKSFSAYYFLKATDKKLNRNHKTV